MASRKPAEKPENPENDAPSEGLCLSEFPMGTHLDKFWAAYFGEDLARFRRKVCEYGVPHRIWGYTIIVAGKDILEYLEPQ